MKSITVICLLFVTTSLFAFGYGTVGATLLEGEVLETAGLGFRKGSPSHRFDFSARVSTLASLRLREAYYFYPIKHRLFVGAGVSQIFHPFLLLYGLPCLPTVDAMVGVESSRFFLQVGSCVWPHADIPEVSLGFKF